MKDYERKNAFQSMRKLVEYCRIKLWISSKILPTFHTTTTIERFTLSLQRRGLWTNFLTSYPHFECKNSPILGGDFIFFHNSAKYNKLDMLLGK